LLSISGKFVIPKPLSGFHVDHFGVNKFSPTTPPARDGQGEESEVFGTSLPKELPEKIGSSLRRHKVP